MYKLIMDEKVLNSTINQTWNRIKLHATNIVSLFCSCEQRTHIFVLICKSP